MSEKIHHTTLEEVVKTMGEVPASVQDAIKRAYDALKELEGFYLCHKDLGYANQHDAYCANLIAQGLGKPQRMAVLVTEHSTPIRYCSFEIFGGSPICSKIEDLMKDLIRKSGCSEIKSITDFRTLREVEDAMPESFSFIGKTLKFKLWKKMNVSCFQKKFFYEEVID